MTAGDIQIIKTTPIRTAGIGVAGLAAAILCGSGMPARAIDTGQETLNVATLERLPDESLGTERGGALTFKFNFNFFLNALATAAGETKFQKNVPEVGSASQTTTQDFTGTVTQTNTANLGTGPVVKFNVVVGP